MNVKKKFESVQSEFKAATEKMAAIMSGSFSIDSFGSLTAEIAELKGKLDALEFIIACHSNEIDDDIIVDQMMDKVLRGADDSWSGRGNEVRRSHLDGFRAITQDFRNSLRWARIDSDIIEVAKKDSK